MIFVIPSLGGGGAERVTVDLANAIVSRGYDVMIVTTGCAGALSSQLDDRIVLVELAARGVASAIPRLARLIHRSRPKALVSIMDHTNLAVWIAKSLARSTAVTVFTSHVNFDFAFEELPRLPRSAVIALYRQVYRRADARIAVSDGVAASLTASLRVPRDAIEVIYNPAFTARVHELAKQPPPRELLPPDALPLIVAAGRLVPQKDFETLLRGFAIAVHEMPLRLVIMGEGPLRPVLAELIGELGLQRDVLLPGFVENPFALLKRARVFVSSSRFEGFGITIVEAMALGVPVVATDCPSGPSEILGGGRYGRLVAVGDSRAIAHALVQAVREPGPIEKARGRASEFGIDVATEKYLRIACDTHNPR
jgi:glycosyltransferase involved in cell wall biosynthesis